MFLAFLGDAGLYFKISTIVPFAPEFLTIQHCIVIFVAFNASWISLYFIWEIVTSSKGAVNKLHSVLTLIPVC